MTHLLFCFTVCQQNKQIINERCRFVILHEPAWKLECIETTDRRAMKRSIVSKRKVCPDPLWERSPSPIAWFKVAYFSESGIQFITCQHLQISVTTFRRHLKTFYFQPCLPHFRCPPCEGCLVGWTSIVWYMKWTAVKRKTVRVDPRLLDVGKDCRSDEVRRFYNLWCGFLWTYLFS